MTTARSRTKRRSTPAAVSPEEYGAFIRQIELMEIRLAKAEVWKNPYPVMPGESADIEVFLSANWYPRDAGFLAEHSYQVSLEADDAPASAWTIEVSFELEFCSATPMTDAIFETFKEANLPVNTWPYLREFVQSMVVRMGYPPVTLPVLKLGTERPAS